MNPQDPNNQYPQHNDDYAQQQAEVQRQMQQIMASPDHMSASPKPSRGLGVVALITSILLPPLGFILGTIATIKGFVSKKDSILGVMGLISMLLSTLLIAALAAVLTSSSSNSSDPTQDINEAEALSFSGAEINFDVPIYLSEKDKTDGYIVWSSPDDSSSTVSLGVSRTESVISNSPTELIDINKANKVYEGLWGKLNSDELKPCDSPVYQDARYFEHTSADLSAQITFTCQQPNNSSESVYRGEYIVMMFGEYEVRYLSYMSEDLWSVDSGSLADAIKNTSVDY